MSRDLSEDFSELVFFEEGQRGR